MSEQGTPRVPEPPRCPDCAVQGVKTNVVLVEHGYHMAPVYWDATICDWTTYQDAWLRSWECTESYWQCNTCFWQGDDPIGLEDDDGSAPPF